MRYLCKPVDRLGEDGNAYRTKPLNDALKIRENSPARKKPKDDSRRALDKPMRHEYAHYLAAREAKRLQKPDLGRLLNSEDEKRVHHAEERNEGNEKQQDRRHVLLDGERGK